MASGRLAAINPTSLAQTTIYSAPADTYSVVTIHVFNNGSTNTTLDISIVNTSGDNPVNPTDYIEYKTVLEAGSQMERTGIVLGSGQTVKCFVSGSDVGIQVWGIETEV
jgi:hypothetical protein